MQEGVLFDNISWDEVWKMVEENFGICNWTNQAITLRGGNIA